MFLVIYKTLDVINNTVIAMYELERKKSDSITKKAELVTWNIVKTPGNNSKIQR